MNTPPNTGGPAFPFRTEDGYDGYEQYYGMTLRDWFAGQALQLAGAYAIAQTLAGAKPPLNENDLAKRAYQTADAMLAAREQSTQSKP